MKQSTCTYTSSSVTAAESGQKAVSQKVSHALHTYPGRHSDFSVPQHIGVDQWNGYLSESSIEIETVNFSYLILYYPTNALNYINYRIVKNTLKL